MSCVFNRKSWMFCFCFGNRALIFLAGGRPEKRIFPAWIGKCGASIKRTEGSFKTPIGIFSVGEVFYSGQKPETVMPCFAVTESTYYIDDERSPNYNTHLESIFPPAFHAEHMADYQEYRLGFVIRYNENPVRKGRGSAIFFHCGQKPTAGCIAARENDVRKTVRWLNCHTKIMIL